MIKTILFAKQTPLNHPALGPVFDVVFTDNTTLKTYAETFFDQIEGWKPDQPLEGKTLNLDLVYTVV